MAIRATVTHVNAAISITNVRPEAIVTKNDSSINQFFYESSTLSDVNIIVITKSLVETVTITELYENGVSKNVPTDTISLSETFSKVITYNKVFNDAFVLDDATTINKNYYGNKGNIFGLSDTIGVSFSKNFNDTITFSDVTTAGYQVNRDFYENVKVVDGTQPTLLNAHILNSPVLNIGETSTAALSFTQAPHTDSFGIGDSTNVAPNKGLSNLLNIGDENSLQLAKTINEIITLSDTNQVVKTYGEITNNNVGISDQVTVDYFYGGLLGQAPLNAVNLN